MYRLVARMYMIYTDGKFQVRDLECLQKDKFAEFVQVPVYFPSPARISKTIPIVFVLGRKNKISSLEFIK